MTQPACKAVRLQLARQHHGALRKAVRAAHAWPQALSEQACKPLRASCCAGAASHIKVTCVQMLRGSFCAGVATYVKDRFSPLAARADCLDGGGDSDLDCEGRRAP